MSRVFFGIRRFWRISPTAFLFFLVSLINLITPPNSFFWMASILTKEYGHLFALFGLFLSYQLWKRGFRRRAGFLAIPILIFLGPLWDGLTFESMWKKNLQDTFSSVTQQVPDKLISFKVFLLGHSGEKIKPKTLVYKKNNLQELTLDFYPSNSNKPSPWIVIVHGGSWQSGSSKELPELNSYLANRGISVVAINYSLMPEYRWPQPKIDLQEAILFLKEKASELNLDPYNYFLMGRSAGGQIAAVTAFQSTDPALKGLISVYAPLDLNFGYWAGDEDDIVESRPLLRNYLTNSPQLTPEIYSDASPVESISEKRPIPTLMIYGKPDTFVWYKHAEIAQEKLTQNKIPNVLILLPWATHGFDYTPRGPAGQVTFKSIEYFINQLLNK